MNCIPPIVSFWTTMTSLRTTATVFSLHPSRMKLRMNLLTPSLSESFHRRCGRSKSPTKRSEWIISCEADWLVNAKLNYYNCCRFQRAFIPELLLLLPWASERGIVVRWEYTSPSLLVHIKTLLRTAIRYGNKRRHQKKYQKISEDRLDI